MKGTCHNIVLIEVNGYEAVGFKGRPKYSPSRVPSVTFPA